MRPNGGAGSGAEFILSEVKSLPACSASNSKLLCLCVLRSKVVHADSYRDAAFEC